MTYDLSETIADNANDIPPWLADLLHYLIPDALVGSFLRDQAKCQGLNLTQQLNNGIRFLDFRIVYTAGPSIGDPIDWYSLHLVSSNKKASEYLKEIRAWLDAHPKEIIVMWLSRHGSECLNGTDQYPGVTVKEKQAFFNQILDIFSGLVTDHNITKVNETTLNEMIARKHRVVFYATDFMEFTGGSQFALDACLIDNELKGGVTNAPASSLDQVNFFENCTAVRAERKKENKFLLMSMATSGPDEQIKDSALLHFQPFDHDAITKDCAKSFNIPNLTDWCPRNLQDVSQLTEYYNQRTVEYAHTHNYEFPNAIYTDAIDVDGTYRTGTDRFGALPDYEYYFQNFHKVNKYLESQGISVDKQAIAEFIKNHNNTNNQNNNNNKKDNNNKKYGDENGTTKYAYVATVLYSMVRKGCTNSSKVTSKDLVEDCASVKASLDALRGVYPLKTWNDPTYGRDLNWP
eukprot:CAMPEP_0174264720 /NCGR_PEP_ID=MMETSP0439-20130205/23612_1 /TAXON_ID=0 /ORGANISM="Stereomyxa ramosa, Strain Chinc5" /LENGTH=460 /DNA_ID=CAMNT_0015350749 /DNA_START=157 /DNA_END=1535 /DNA_ORIENTATION=+